MNLGNITLENKCEKAVRLLSQYAPAEENRKKPILMHALRVGMYLYEHNYAEDVVLAGLLHDTIEWTDCSAKLIQDTFGPHILAIVLANTKDRGIENEVERQKDLINRCLIVGKDALIVKAADTLDSYSFYESTNNQEEIQRAIIIGKVILGNLPSTMQDPLFEKLHALK